MQPQAKTSLREGLRKFAEWYKEFYMKENNYGYSFVFNMQTYINLNVNINVMRTIGILLFEYFF